MAFVFFSVSGLRGNERADYLARTAASYNTIIAYNAIPIYRGKQLLEEHYIKIWKATHINSANASHTKQFISAILQTFPFPMAKLHPHAIPNKSRQIPFMPPQNKKDPRQRAAVLKWRYKRPNTLGQSAAYSQATDPQYCKPFLHI